MKKSIELNIIGTLKTPHFTTGNMPIQPVGAKGVIGTVELFPEFVEGLRDIEGFSHLILIYHFHQQKDYELIVTPFMDDKEHGIFATRSPKRPSAVGISTVKFLRIENDKLYFEGADMLNDTPLIDIKPFFRQTDNRPEAKSGWLDEKTEDMATKTLSDTRFANAQN